MSGYADLMADDADYNELDVDALYVNSIQELDPNNGIILYNQEILNTPSNQLVFQPGNKYVINAVNPLSNRIYNIVDVSGNADFIMSNGSQTIRDKTLSNVYISSLSSLNITGNLDVGGNVNLNTISYNGVAGDSLRIKIGNNSGLYVNSAFDNTFYSNGGGFVLQDNSLGVLSRIDGSGGVVNVRNGDFNVNGNTLLKSNTTILNGNAVNLKISNSYCVPLTPEPIDLTKFNLSPLICQGSVLVKGPAYFPNTIITTSTFVSNTTIQALTFNGNVSSYFGNITNINCNNINNSGIINVNSSGLVMNTGIDGYDFINTNGVRTIELVMAIGYAPNYDFSFSGGNVSLEGSYLVNTRGIDVQSDLSIGTSYIPSFPINRNLNLYATGSINYSTTTGTHNFNNDINLSSHSINSVQNINSTTSSLTIQSGLGYDLNLLRYNTISSITGIYINNNVIRIASGNLKIESGYNLQLDNASGTFSTKIKEGASTTTNKSYILPLISPTTANDFLTCDTSGNMAWANNTKYFSMTADGTTLTNSTVQTSILGSGVGTKTIKTSEIAAGSTYKITGSGKIKFLNNELLVLTWRYGTDFLLNMNKTFTPTLATLQPFYFDAYITFRTVGASATVQASGIFMCQDNTFNYNSSLLLNSIAINTTADQDFDLRAQWTTASTSNSIQLLTYNITKIY